MAEYNFHEQYPGPTGPHLNYLSRFTLTRKEEHRLAGRSIRGAGKNTSKPSTGARQRRTIAAIDAHLERHPNDEQSKAHVAWLRNSAA